MDMSTGSWVRSLFADLDSAGVEGLFPYLHDEVNFRFASYPGATGKQTFAEAWAAMSPHIASLQHTLLEDWHMGETVICRGEVTYTLKDGREYTLPFTNIFKLADDKIKDYLIYVDASPVFGVSTPP